MPLVCLNGSYGPAADEMDSISVYMYYFGLRLYFLMKKN